MHNGSIIKLLTGSWIVSKKVVGIGPGLGDKSELYHNTLNMNYSRSDNDIINRICSRIRWEILMNNKEYGADYWNKATLATNDEVAKFITASIKYHIDKYYTNYRTQHVSKKEGEAGYEDERQNALKNLQKFNDYDDFEFDISISDIKNNWEFNSLR